MKKIDGVYVLNESEFRTMKAILFDVFCTYEPNLYGFDNMPDLNCWMGSETMERGRELMWEADWLDYCTRHEVAYKDLDEFDYQTRWEEEHGWGEDE